MSSQPNAATHLPEITAGRRRTLDGIFHHPTSHNLGWMDVLDLLTTLGTAEEKSDGKYSLRVNGKHLVFHKPHSKHLTSDEVMELRHFLMSADISPNSQADGTKTEDGAPKLGPKDVVVVIDHHGAKLYQLASSGDQAGESPYHFLHHLSHKDQAHERGQRAYEDLNFYDRVGEALRGVDQIVILSHGAGESDAGEVLMERLGSHHPGVYGRIVREGNVNTSALTEPQIIAYARRLLAP